jgi:sugar lactone lactonase YvrE
LEPNNILSKGKRIFVNELYGPESFAVDKNGVVYTGTKDGRIWKIVNDKPVEVMRFRKGMTCNDESSPEELQMCSRPLGLHFHPNGLLYVADAYNGLYSVNVSSDVEESKRKQLVWDINTDIIGGERTVLLNNMAFLKNGSILMTTSSYLYRLHNLRDEYLRMSPTGSLIIFTPGIDGGRTYNLVDRLHFANGLLLSEDESHVLVPETATARIIRYVLTGPKAGTWDIFADNLPGLPDNLSYSKKGTIWVPLAGTRKHPLLDLLFKRPWLRKIICKLNIDLLGVLARLPSYGIIIEVDPKDGHIVGSYHDPLGVVVREATEVIDIGEDDVYIGSYVAPYLVRASLKGV